MGVFGREAIICIGYKGGCGGHKALCRLPVLKYLPVNELCRW